MPDFPRIPGLDHFMLFNNNSTITAGGMGSSNGDGTGSIAIEFKLDLAAKTIKNIWQYKASPKIDNQIMGDLQRMPNGNTVVAYSTKGVIQEVDANGTLLVDWGFPLGAQFGYIEKRATLYGPPPK